MKNLRTLRERHNYTQKDLATHLGTSQQTVARWENGKSQPKLSVINDIAVFFGVSTDYLLGARPAIEHQSVSYFDYLAGDDGGFWGHIGIRLPRENYTKWYPVSGKTTKQVFSNIQDDDPDNWINFQTLNNRLIFFDPDKIDFITFLDEADDSVCQDDWELLEDAKQGWPEHYYKCIEHIIDGEPEHEKDQFSEKIISISRNMISKLEFNEDKLFRFIFYTSVYIENNRIVDIFCSAKRISDLFFEMDLSPLVPVSKMILLDDGYGGREVFFPREKVVLIETPLLPVNEEIKRELKDVKNETDEQMEGASG